MNSAEIINALRATKSRSKRALLDAAADLIENQQHQIDAQMYVNEGVRHHCEMLCTENRTINLQYRWIPVSERLPKDRSNVLVVAYWHERWGVYMGWCAPERAEWYVHVGIGDRDDVAVTYWMPLPAAPEED